MAKGKTAQRVARSNYAPQNGSKASAFELRDPKEALSKANPDLHIYGKNNSICLTNSRGQSTRKGRSLLELWFDATEGFVPVWGPNVVLHWRFNDVSMQYFQRPEAAKQAIRELFGEAVARWGDASPVRFSENEDSWDFEITMQPSDVCSSGGCVLARAFFPDSGRHDIALYPRLFAQSHEEQIETLIHELGHVYGLRHFFANLTETQWPSVPFGTQTPFTIMNYGPQSQLTEQDKLDLKLFYSKVWSGELATVANTPIVQFRPFHESLPLQTALQPALLRQCPRCGAYA
jgi:hypothetical protein